MASFLESVGVTLLAAFVAACWHILSRNEKAEVQELAVGFDLLVSAMVLQTGFLPGSDGWDLGLRWGGLALISVIALPVMAVATKMWGYEKSKHLRWRRESGRRVDYDPVEQMTSKAAWFTSIAGSAMLCVFWWLNVNIGLVVTAWKGAVH